MNNKKTILALVALVLVVGVFAGVWFATRPQSTEGRKTFTLCIVHGICTRHIIAEQIAVVIVIIEILRAYHTLDLVKNSHCCTSTVFPVFEFMNFIKIENRSCFALQYAVCFEISRFFRRISNITLL